MAILYSMFSVITITKNVVCEVSHARVAAKLNVFRLVPTTYLEYRFVVIAITKENRITKLFIEFVQYVNV